MLVFISNYFDYFGLNFLFTQGGLPTWYSIPRVGLLYLVELPFIVIGIYFLVKQRDIFSKIPLVWILAAPIVPAITMDDIPNINRAVVIFPMLNVVAAGGFFALSESARMGLASSLPSNRNPAAAERRMCSSNYCITSFKASKAFCS